MSIVGGATKSTAITEYVFTALFAINPLFTFYLTNYLIVIDFINKLAPDDVPEIFIPFAFGLKGSFKLSMLTFCFQFFLYMSLTMCRDSCMSGRFRSKDNQKVKI